MNDTAGPLVGLRVLDLTRILAGPTCTQLLGDLGADVVKVERPGRGDDTRTWGPPFLPDPAGQDTQESAYFLSSNRNKRSITLDIAHAEGQRLLKRLVEHCDVLIENFKVGALARYGLGYEQLKAEFPGLVYCSVTGFGQTGPYAARAGYDFLAQGLGGIMSITGEPDGAPMKVGVGIADVMCGMYAAVGILAALRHRDATGEGQHIDIALLDSQVAWLINEGLNYLVSGKVPPRRGNAHPNIVPYELFQASDGPVIICVGNDAQFRRLCAFAGAPELAEDARFATNPDRLRNREACVAAVAALVPRKSRHEWVAGLERLGVPCGPVNDIARVFDDPQVKARAMKLSMPHPLSDGEVALIANPLKLSGTPASYRRPPPFLGQHTFEVLAELLDMDMREIMELYQRDVL